MAHILLDNVGVAFSVRQHGRMTLKEFVVRGMFRRKVNPKIAVQALRDVNIDVRDGDRLGIIGHNGAGKSTLLKTIAGVYPPSAGRCVTQGRISSLFDVTLGFEPDATGWENIAYRGYLQGETPRTIAKRIDAIAEFTELGDRLGMPLRYYSTGMTVRLGFAIATSIEPEILIIDEILSAGDIGFQQKARERMESMIRTARVVVLASHDLPTLEGLCDKVMWMDHGTVRMYGPASEVIAAYSGRAPALAQAA
ncbi:MAG TPA: ABC transporter ATP-binding protein [Pirellulales bacterium]|jgi:ABC-type polysaccharide/polyol phosphate transport system ATPase subunit|nr:ABC transporter ATP-binding protein [Pirellulales bacterium]